MTNSKDNQKVHTQQDSSSQHKGSSQQNKDGKQPQKHASGAGRGSGVAAHSDDELETNNDITDDPEGTKKKIPQMKK